MTQTLTRARRRGDSFVSLPDIVCPRPVVLERSCSVHAALPVWPLRPRVCVVNVKLTMGLGFGPGRLISVLDHAAGFSKDWRDGHDRLASNRSGHRAGRVGDPGFRLSENPPGAKRQTRPGGLSAEPS